MRTRKLRKNKRDKKPRGGAEVSKPSPAIAPAIAPATKNPSPNPYSDAKKPAPAPAPATMSNKQGMITTVAGNGEQNLSGDGGVATNASLSTPYQIALDNKNNIFITDAGNNRIRRVEASTGIITTVAGNDNWGFSGDGGPATNASLNTLSGVAVDKSDNIYICDVNNRRIRRIHANTGIITTVAGNGILGSRGYGGPATSASMKSPSDVAVDNKGNIFIADPGNNRIRRVDASTGIITTVAGDGAVRFRGDGGPAVSASLKLPQGVVADTRGNLIILDTYNQRIRRVAANTGIITTIAGNGTTGFSGDGGPATSASFNTPYGVTVDNSGNVFIADTYNQRIRRVDAKTGIITTVAGNGDAGFSDFSDDKGIATKASLWNPEGIAIDSSGNLLIADSLNHRIRKVTGPFL